MMQNVSWLCSNKDRDRERLGEKRATEGSEEREGRKCKNEERAGEEGRERERKWK